MTVPAWVPSLVFFPQGLWEAVSTPGAPGSQCSGPILLLTLWELPLGTWREGRVGLQVGAEALEEGDRPDPLSAKSGWVQSCPLGSPVLSPALGPEPGPSCWDAIWLGCFSDSWVGPWGSDSQVAVGRAWGGGC